MPPRVIHPNDWKLPKITCMVPSILSCWAKISILKVFVVVSSLVATYIAQNYKF